MEEGGDGGGGDGGAGDGGALLPVRTRAGLGPKTPACLYQGEITKAECEEGNG